MVNYCGRFIPNLASISAPLRELTKSDVPWQWDESQSHALKLIKQQLANSCSMAYFDPQSATELLVDASPVGLGAMLTQRNANNVTSVVALASRALTAVEQRYSQTEREALAITWAVSHFHLYLYGGPFMVITDHKPLVPLFNNSNAKPSLRLERGILTLQAYDYTVQYQPGKHNPADYMSRHPYETPSSSIEQTLAEAHIHFISNHAIRKSVTRDEIASATKADIALQMCMEAIKRDNWNDVLTNADEAVKNELKCLHNVRDELSVSESGDLLLRDHRIIVPQVLRKRIIDIAHEGHQGITKTKALIREKVWFPAIDRLTESIIRDCLPCQATVIEHSKEPLIMSPLPKKAWSEVSVDFADLPSGEHLLVVVDDFSRFPEVEIVPSTSALHVIPKLDRIFSSYGVPEIVRTDNGPPFQSHAFADFAQYLGFTHRRVTPRWPQANGEVERFMKTLKKAYRTAFAERKPWKQELYKFLRNYRVTPHATTQTPPATLLFGRPIRARLPEPVSAQTPPDDNDLRARDHSKKSQIKAHADKRGNTQRKAIQVGDTVLVRRDGFVPKHQSPYIPVPYQVKKKNGSLVTVQRGSHQITRNVSRFKKYSGPDRNEAQIDDDDFDVDSAPVHDAPIPQAQPRRNPARYRRPPMYLNDYTRH